MRAYMCVCVCVCSRLLSLYCTHTRTSFRLNSIQCLRVYCILIVIILMWICTFSHLLIPQTKEERETELEKTSKELKIHESYKLAMRIHTQTSNFFSFYSFAFYWRTNANILLHNSYFYMCHPFFSLSYWNLIDRVTVWDATLCRGQFVNKWCVTWRQKKSFLIFRNLIGFIIHSHTFALTIQ